MYVESDVIGKLRKSGFQLIHINSIKLQNIFYVKFLPPNNYKVAEIFIGKKYYDD